MIDQRPAIEQCQGLVTAEAARLEAEYDTERLKALINAEGWAQA